MQLHKMPSFAYILQHLQDTLCSLSQYYILTFGYVGLEVESSEFIHALFGLWGFGRLQFTLWFLEDKVYMNMTVSAV